MRFVPLSTVEMGITAIVDGHPVGIPKYWLKQEVEMTVDYSLLLVRPPEDDTADTHSGLNTPDYVWYASDLDAPTDADGYNLSSWPEHNGGPSWHSSGAYRPNVRKRRFRTKKGHTTWPKSVYFDNDSVNHMWIDLEETLDQPYTIIIVGIIHSYPSATFGHYILDAGKPSPSLNINKDHRINDHVSYRSALLFQRSSGLIATNTQSDLTYGKHGRCKHNYRPFPRMFFGVFNGDHSRVGAFDKSHRFFGRGKTDGKHPRYLVLGRRNNRISDNLTAHMTVVEIQIHKKAMTKKQLVRQYKSLAGKYKFNQIKVP